LRGGVTTGGPADLDGDEEFFAALMFRFPVKVPDIFLAGDFGLGGQLPPMAQMMAKAAEIMSKMPPAASSS
jgi:hypothetical protein